MVQCYPDGSAAFHPETKNGCCFLALTKAAQGACINDTVKRIRCDNAKEYVSGELQKVARNAGVEIDPCPPYTPQLNGVAERMNRTLFDKARAMLYDSKLPKKLLGICNSRCCFLAQQNSMH
ncbi:hypothetical protein AVEN_83675-1 [Araneus ventricosus]|uniref:Integrase catalytic domain-containing protein n=1 Tax=Araneus ventricosus TaxID=182803 RepID=A0A4Y2EZ63_ARAVE|nr:hypothetical protein AVEN_83675-1 [Araneus ventricosus]